MKIDPEIIYLSVTQLHPYKKQARKIFENLEIESLAETIKEHGIRQPLTVLRVQGDTVHFEVVSGERRLRAAKKLGLEKVPCIIIENEERQKK
jgi:ParB family chromosome partitioning protein